MILLDVLSIIILIIGLVITALEYLKQENDFKKIEEEQKGRFFEDKQTKNIVEKLEGVSKVKIILSSTQGDRESLRFANSIKDLFTILNWEIDGVYEDIIIGGVGSGLLIRENNLKDNSVGKTINRIMNQNEIKSRIIQKSDIDVNLIEIIVGSHP